MSTGFDKSPSHAVKPFGGLEDPFICISSYPTLDALSTVHHDNSVDANMSNQSIAHLYTQLGFHVATMRSSGMLRVDIFSKRIDRKLALDNQDTILDRQPKELRQHWRQFAMRCIEQSSSRAALVTEHAANQVYKQYLHDQSKLHDAI